MEFIDEAREQYLGSMANFTRCEVPEGAVSEGPLSNAAHVSGGISGSMYWYTEEGVYRLSNHWGEGVGSSNWYLDGGWVGLRPELLVEKEDGTIESFCPYPESSAPDIAEGEAVCGFCPWDGFQDADDSMYNRVHRLYQSGVEPPFPPEDRETNQRRLLARVENQDLERLMRDPISDASLYFGGLDDILSKAAKVASANCDEDVMVELVPCVEGRFSDPEQLRYRMRIHRDGALVLSQDVDVKVLPLEIAAPKQVQDGTVNIDAGGYVMPPPAETLESFCDVLERMVGNRSTSARIRNACGNAPLRVLSDMAAVVSSYARLATRVNRKLSIPKRMSRISRADVPMLPDAGEPVPLVPPDGLDEDTFLRNSWIQDPDYIQSDEFSREEYRRGPWLGELIQDVSRDYGIAPLPKARRPSIRDGNTIPSPFTHSRSRRHSGANQLSYAAICDEMADMVESGRDATEGGSLAPMPEGETGEKSVLDRACGFASRIASMLSADSNEHTQSNFAGTEGTVPSPLVVDVRGYVQHRRDKFGRETVVHVGRYLRRNGNLPKTAKRRGREHRV